MFEHNQFDIDEPFTAPLAAAEIDDFDKLMFADLGTVIRSKHGQEVRRLTVSSPDGDKVFYLKRSHHPANACRRELALIHAMQQHGIAVMRPAAWGRCSAIGITCHSFLMTEQVQGDELDDLFAGAGSRVRGQLATAMGVLLGRLSRAGFYHRLRLRDLICTQVPAGAHQPAKLTLIDREATRAGPRRHTSGRCYDCLARCYCKLIQTGHDLNNIEKVRFVIAYLGALDGLSSPSRRALIREVTRRVDRLIEPGRKYHGINAASRPGPRIFCTSDMDWQPANAAVLPAGELIMTIALTRADDRRGAVLRVVRGDREYMLKRRVYGRIGQRLWATLGRSPLDNEFAMMQAARSAGLATAAPIALGRRRHGVLIREQALLADWVNDCQPLRQFVVAATQAQDESRIHTAQDAYAALAGRVRRAGMADRDFGLGNVLVREREQPLQPIWTDLEAAYHARANDGCATCDTVAAAMVSWWVATQGHEPWFETMFASMCRYLPEPRNGWASVLMKLNRSIETHMAKQLRHERIDRAPPPLHLALEE